VRKQVKGTIFIIAGLVLMMSMMIVGLTVGAQADLGTTGIFGTVGIGTDNPQRPLHLLGNACLFERDQDSAGFIIKRTAANRWVFGVDELPSSMFVIKTYPEGQPATVRVAIDTSGRVGIGVLPDTAATLKTYSATGNAVHGNSNSTGTGVAGTSISGMGLYGTSTSNTGVYGSSSTGNAGYFEGRVYVGGSLSTAYTKKTANYTVTAKDSIIAVDSTLGVLAIALPSAIGIAGREYTVKKVDNSGNWVSVSCSGADTIDGVPFKLLNTQYAYLIVVSDGYNWMIVGQSP